MGEGREEICEIVLDFQFDSKFEGKEVAVVGLGEGGSLCCLWWLCSGRRRKDADSDRWSLVRMSSILGMAAAMEGYKHL